MFVPIGNVCESVAFGPNMNISEVLALIGPNGAGKSTLNYLIRGELTADSGNGYLCGDAKSVSAQRHLGACAQYNVLDLLNTEGHLVLFAKIKGVDNVQRNVNTIMAKLGAPPILVLRANVSVVKRAFWKIIRQSPQTTHWCSSIEEADALGHRAAAMSQ
ncbi:hypothetical protein LX36DRAFT_707534 [Colletotrichum falcatum]|nr:hypothetical protein LX36DRAFT_707534 [Colletotrichum falcatum]